MKIAHGLLVAALAVAGLASAAQAADVGRPTYQRPTQTAFAYDWSGVYAGIGVGGNFWSVDYSDNSGVPPTGLPSSKSWDIGGFAGANRQIGMWVFGLEADTYYSRARSTLDTVTCALCKPQWTNTNSAWMPLSGTARGRIGYAFDRWMPYVTGGLAWGQIKSSSFSSFPPFGTSNSFSTQYGVGWAGGVGVDYALTDNFVLGLLYLYKDLGINNQGLQTTGGPGPSNFNSQTGAKEHQLTARASIKF
jgi:outer membrane immunogenic protein